MDIIASVSSAIGLVTKARELADQLKNLELKAVIVDLQGKLLDVKSECLNFREQVERLQAENKRLSEPPEIKLKDGMYFKVADDDGPFCTTCHDKEGKLIRLNAVPHFEARLAGKWRCQACKAYFTGNS